ncbi:hypothetical protein CAPTEDRAFT_218269 [Capitella teleta]|uniref:Cilia- and flagella-associated protein 52 n=1 Tax=Capitella teleta TaxID=283909 RepID=R7VD05_CAPTE|nr:hypothetical protein CAPTEDRAFT_218269 [Capitella teleta]|eukprot:ELU13570.1 hypothetical protein CAPTEDRAFT_218269 [Capitella teleta]
MGQLKRVVRCIEIDSDDSFFYCGTTTGDIIAVNMASKKFQAHGPKELFSLGVTAVTLMQNKDLLIGTGDGTIAVVKGKDCNFKRTSKKAKVEGSVTALAVRGVGHQFFVGTAVSQLYKFNYADFSYEMLFSSHSAPVNDLCFPRGFSDVLITCSKEEIRLWTSPKEKTPAHQSGQHGPTYLTKFESLKQHRAQITHIHIRKNDSECITSSRDGTCITWDLLTLVRIHMVRVNTLFMNVCFHPDEFQFITSGTDRRITFWEKYDASKIRELEGSKSGSVNSMDILENGQHFVSAGDDKLVKVWLYDEGNCTHIGVGHSAQIVGVKVAPNNRFIISISSDGAILKWKFPC